MGVSLGTERNPTTPFTPIRPHTPMGIKWASSQRPDGMANATSTGLVVAVRMYEIHDTRPESHALMSRVDS